MRDNPIEICPLNGSGIDIESTCARTKSLDRSLHSKVAYRAEIDEPDPADSQRRDFFLRDPPFDNAPVVETHVVRSAGDHRAVIDHSIDIRAMHHENTAGDLVGSARWNPTVSIKRLGFEPLDVQTSASITGTAYKDSATADRFAESADRHVDEIRGQNRIFLRLHVP
jgi:hypothetical protein